MRFFWAFFAAMLLASCGSSDDSGCPLKLTNLRAKSLDLTGSTRRKPTDLDEQFAKSVINCNPNFTYVNQQNPLRLEYVFEKPDGQRLIILGMLFVADAKVVIHLDKSGRVEETYLAGM